MKTVRLNTLSDAIRKNYCRSGMSPVMRMGHLTTEDTHRLALGQRLSTKNFLEYI